MDFDEVASGPCIICLKESQGSPYWLPMSAAQWKVVLPYVREMTPVSPHSGIKLVLNMLFWPQLCRPFCSTRCVKEYYKRVAAENLKKGY